MTRASALVLLLALVVLDAGPARAETVIRGGHPVCNSAEQIDTAVRALAAKDMAWFKRLDGGFLWWGVCRVRIGYGKIAWTPCANIGKE